MANIELKYGNAPVSFDYDERRFEVLGGEREFAPLSDAEIGAKLDDPIDSKPIEDIVSGGETVLIVVPDATRRTGCGQIVNLLVRRLIANGTMPFDIRIIFATGIHRRVTEDEKRELLTPFIYQRIKVLDHNPRDLAQLVRLGETSSGIPIDLNRALTEHDHVLIVGGISFHYFAGFTGGRKLICPGLGSTRTIAATHSLAFDCAMRSRRTGVATGVLDGNAVNEAFIEVAGSLPPSFAVNTIVDEQGKVVDLFCGDWLSSHRAACESYAALHTLTINEKPDLVVASCGGYPHDINLIQAHKALDMAARACLEGGTIVLLAECADGLGRKDFISWFAAENSEALAANLCEKYQVNGQTAWNLLRIAEKFDVRIVTALPATETAKMRLQSAQSLTDALSSISETAKGYILPFGAKFLIKTA